MRLWPHVRALLIALHVFAVVAMALPAPGGGMTRSAWADPTVQAELSAWNDKFAAVGFHLSDEAFQDQLFVVATGLMTVREAVLKPMYPYYLYCGTFQSWRMFVAPHVYPARLHIDVMENNEWRPVYVERTEYDWLGTQLDHDRFRSAIFRFSWRQYRKQWTQFGDWTAVQATRDFPTATQVRLRFWKAKSASPEQARAGEVPPGEWVFPIERKLPFTPRVSR